MGELNMHIVVDDIFVYNVMPDETILREDMYQATCGNYTIDCGWYETDEGDCFITYLIKDFDWEQPVVKIITRNLLDAKWSISTCKEYLSGLRLTLDQ